MANQILLIANHTAVDYTNVNAAGDDILAGQCGSTQTNVSGAVTLTDAEQATFAAAHTTALIMILPSVTITAAQRESIRLASKILRLGKNPGTAIT
jgi:hypothetical protein